MLVLICEGCFVCLACGLDCLFVICLVSFGFGCCPLLWWFGLSCWCCIFGFVCGWLMDVAGVVAIGGAGARCWWDCFGC